MGKITFLVASSLEQAERRYRRLFDKATRVRDEYHLALRACTRRMEAADGKEWEMRAAEAENGCKRSDALVNILFSRLYPAEFYLETDDRTLETLGIPWATYVAPHLDQDRLLSNAAAATLQGFLIGKTTESDIRGSLLRILESATGKKEQIRCIRG